jgi:uncharacterized protein YbjT (DUF2867 family)
MAMEQARPEILVSGATGLQGGAVARRLLQDGWPIRFLTRDPDSAKARALIARGARAVRGNLEDIEAARLACRGVYGVFSVQDFWEHGYEREIRQGGNLVDAARGEGVQHFVYASVGGVGRTDGLGITHFDTKAVIEQLLIQSGLAWTILRPVSFMENFTTELMLDRIFRTGVVSFPFPGDRPFQLVAVEDEADMVAAAFANPDQFIGLAMEIASDQRCLTELAQAIADSASIKLQFREVPPDLFAGYVAHMTKAGLVGQTKVGPSLVPQLCWNRESPDGGWAADIAAVRKRLPTLRSVETWAASVDWQAARARHTQAASI